MYDKPRHSIKSRDIAIRPKTFFIGMLLLTSFMIIPRDLQNDTWFLLNSGRYVFESGIPYVEPFTIHTGFEFVMQQWLSASIFWLFYSGLGPAGLHILVLICYSAIVYSIYKICMLVSSEYFLLSFGITLLSSFLLSMWMTDRPTIFSTLILVVELYLLEKNRFTKNSNYLFPLPFLSILLINLHAAIWPMIFVVLLPYVVESFHFKIHKFENHGYKKAPILLTTIITIIAGIINPYGLQAMLYLVKSYGAPEIGEVVGEMQPPDINTFYGLFIYGTILFVVSIYIFKSEKDIQLRYVLLTLGTIFMTMSVMRNFIYFAVAGLFPLAYFLRNVEISVILPTGKIKKASNLRITLIIVIIIVCVGTVIAFPMTTKYRTENVSSDILLANAIEHVLEHEQQSNVILYTGYDEGGMAEFMGLRTYIDPRAEAFLKKNNKKFDILKEYTDLQFGKIYYKDFLNKYKFTHLIVTKYDILYTYLKSDSDYRISYSNDQYTLYEKSAQQ